MFVQRPPETRRLVLRLHEAGTHVQRPQVAGKSARGHSIWEIFERTLEAGKLVQRSLEAE
jgi:hypothetical protein